MTNERRGHLRPRLVAPLAASSLLLAAPSRARAGEENAHATVSVTDSDDDATAPEHAGLAKDADAGQAPVLASSPANTAATPVPPPLAAEVVVVRGTRTPTEARRLQESADAVTVVDLTRARRRTTDLAEQLARTQGVSVQRSGGLGGHMHLSLNGLYDAQVRTFIDGVPWELEMFPQQLGDVPVNLLERVEVYRGVVPIRFGADALGGAINLVQDRRPGSGAGASYQVGAFGTRRLTAAARAHDERTGLVLRANAFVDHTRNDYDIDVDVADERGRTRTVRVERFHDAFRAVGGSIEAGLVDRRWADELTVRAFRSSYEKELLNDPHIFVGPWGEVLSGETRTGGALRYRVRPSEDVRVEVLAHYAYRSIRFFDASEFVYDWFGRRIRERPVRGETGTVPFDQTQFGHGFYGQALVAWNLSSALTLRANATPRYTTRTGEERLGRDATVRHPITADRRLLTSVFGAELELDALSFEGRERLVDDGAERARFAEGGTGPNDERSGPGESSFDKRLQNILFIKSYFLDASYERALPNGNFFYEDRSEQRFGIGDGVRFRLTPSLLMKASYEYATRLPQPDEVFGDGIRVLPNLDIRPETAHNVNIGPRLDARRTVAGAFTAEVNGFARYSDHLIVLLAGNRVTRFENVYMARSVGVEGALRWTSPGRHVSADATGSYQDVRNRSDRGTFSEFAGDRLPNRPYLFASFGAQAHLERFFRFAGGLEIFWAGRYTHEFFRTWESAGISELKPLVASQFGHNVGATYEIGFDRVRSWTTLEVQNVTDARLFDFFGIQRPGRAVYLKWTGEL